MDFKFFDNDKSIDHDRLYLGKEGADVHFIIRENCVTKRIPAHKYLLVSQSKVFEAMFSGNWKEGDVELMDVSFGAFVQFLEYFYWAEVCLTSKYVGEVMVLGDRYDVEKCVNHCSSYLAELLDENNILYILNCALVCRKDDLITLCEEQLLLNTSTILRSCGFYECNKDVLEHILNMRRLSCPEVEIFVACLEWVKVKSKSSVLSKEMVEKHLGKLFYQIRFASMTVEELCNLPTEYNQILADDFFTIAKIITVPGFSSRNFNTNQR